MKRILLLWILLTGCSAPPPAPPSSWQEVAGRELRHPIYRLRVPFAWKREDFSLDDRLEDTTKPLCTFVIEEEQRRIEITLHNFPTATINERVACGAQVARWRRQFTELDPLSESTKPQAFGGFAGLVFYGEGTMKEKRQAMLAWAMQLPSEFFLKFSVEKDTNARQMRADYTIKAVGDPELLFLHREEIEAFARSFELINEIPS